MEKLSDLTVTLAVCYCSTSMASKSGSFKESSNFQEACNNSSFSPSPGSYTLPTQL